MTMKIRRARTEDWVRIRDLCCLTANGGSSIDRARWEFFGEQWVGPYERLLPEWTWVAVDAVDRVQGYLTCCPDTIAFRRVKAWRFTLPLLARLAGGRYLANGDTRRFARRALHLDRGPEESFPEELRRRIFQQYPAHLHMNVDGRFRSAGLGKLLIEACLAELRQKHIPGIHLFCGPMPLAFYQRNGFGEIGRLEFRPGVWVYALGAKI